MWKEIGRYPEEAGGSFWPPGQSNPEWRREGENVGWLFNHSVVSDSFWNYGLQHARLPCPSLSPRVCSNSVHGVNDAIQPSHPLLPLLFLPSIFPRIRVFSNVSVLHIRWPKYWSFSISPSSEYSGLISFKIDWVDLLAVGWRATQFQQSHQGTPPDEFGQLKSHVSLERDLP